MTSEMAFLGGLQLRAHRFTCQCQDSEDTLVHAAKRFSSAESLQAFDVGPFGKDNRAFRGVVSDKKTIPTFRERLAFDLTSIRNPNAGQAAAHAANLPTW